MTIALAFYTLGLAIWHAQLWFKGLTPADRDALQAENNRLTAQVSLLEDILHRPMAQATLKRQPAKRRNAA
jgi:hypothetical protein